MQAGTGPAHIFSQGAGRPSSAWRPGTSRPGTSFGQGHGHGGYDIQPGAGAEPIMEQEIYEESEDEDVFAFLPPSTADAEAEQRQQETQGGFVSGPGAMMAADQAYYYPQQHQHNPFAHDPVSMTMSPQAGSDPSHYPFATEYPQSYPYAYAYEPEAAATYASAPPAPEASFGHIQAFGGGGGGIHGAKQSKLHQPPPQSPPSTDSQPSTGYGMAGHDAYKLRRLSTAPLGERDIGVTSVVDEEEEFDTRTSLSNPSPAPSASRRGEEVRISLPGVGKKSLDREKDKFVIRDLAEDLERGAGGRIAMKDVDGKPDSKGRKRSRKKSAGKSGSNPATGGEAGAVGALTTEEGLRKRSRNVNAGPYYAYERFTLARNGRGNFF